MSKEPSFEGTRRPEAHRRYWIASWTERLKTARKTLSNPVPYSPQVIEWTEQELKYCQWQLDKNLGELGVAWDHLEAVLVAAKEDEHIQKSKGAMELLEIMHSIAATALGDDGIDQLLAHLTPVFRSHQAWLNQQKKVEKYETARRWFLDRVYLDPKFGSKSNNQLARDWAPKIKAEFGFAVAESTIVNTWLKQRYRPVC